MTPIEQAREVIARCRQLAECSETHGETTRTFLSAPIREVHNRIGGWMSSAGMEVRVDAAGNIRGLYSSSAEGQGPAPRFFIGSHLDTVPNAGAFDGVLGVLLGVALVASLGAKRFPFSLEVIGFSEEEGVRFGVPFIGSRAFAGSFDPTVMARRDAEGRSLADAIRAFGLDPNRLSDAQAPTSAAGYLEFHIEQGPVLDDLNLPLAVVDAIAGQTRVDVAFSGTANHAGTTPMRTRRDALAGAAEWIAAVERDARATSGLVATVGRVRVDPNAGNVIPGRCELSLDVRHADDAVRAAAVTRLAESARGIAAHRTLDATWEPRLDQGGVPMDPGLSARLTRAVEQAGFPVHRMPSGAGHDAMIVAARMPAAMLFIRCEKGISHHPSESVQDRDVAAALEVGQVFLSDMARASNG
jgi:allantoate deiminase